MAVIVVIVLIFFVLAGGLGAVAYITYQRRLRRAKAIERGLKMVPILIHLPPPSSDTAMGSRDVREVMREKTAQAEVLYNLIAGTATEGFKSKFYGQRHLGLEIVATGGLVHFYAVVPVGLVSVVEKALLTAYPGARLEQVEDHNIFNQEGRLAATMGGEMVLRAESSYPIATYEQVERDPMEALLTTTSALGKKDGVAVQIMVRPATGKWLKRSVVLADQKRKGRAKDLGFSAADLVQAAIKAPSARAEEHSAAGKTASNLELSEVEKIEEKTKHPGFEVLIRVLVSTDSVARSQQLLRDIATTFALFESPGMNGFRFLPALDVQGLVTAFIFRFFPPEINRDVLNSVELATLFHLPDSQFTPSASVERQHTKQVDGPVQLPAVGLLFGYNEYRGVRKEIRLSPEDRRRHTYILGQTGTGKSTMLENLAVQDMVNGNGFAFIDPHGDSAEKLLALVPKERAEDVIYFNPADTEYPLGLNLFEFNDPMQKDFLIQETIDMLYRLYDPGHTGIIGPRYEHWYRNAALTLMSDPNGSTFIEIPKVFTDTEYLKQKFKYLRDPTVIDFWTKEMGQTSDYHKSEMLGWFVSKFGAFQNNEMMRNIIGQTKSSFNLRDVMDRKKILIVNLSKGRVGELNSQLLGMIFVIKIQAAAMSRADVPEEQRPDFSLYVDEFQNFSTDSFANILSEARKYHLNLVVANQFIGQLKPEVRDAVFGNIGTIVAHRMGPEDAEFMVRQFAPVFDVGDLVNIPNFNAVMRLMISGLPSQPFSIANSAPLGVANLEMGLAIKQLSAAKFGRAKMQVEAEILTRLEGRAPAPVSPPAPTVSAPVVTGVSAAPAVAGAMGAPVAVGPTTGTTPVIPAAPADSAPVAPAIGPAPTSAPVPVVAPAPVQAAVMEPVIPPAPSSVPITPTPPAAPIVDTQQPRQPSDPGTLSVMDITGGKLPAVRPVDPASVPLVEAPIPQSVSAPVASEPVAAAVAPVEVAPDVVAPALSPAVVPATPEVVAPVAPEPEVAPADLNVDTEPSTAGLPEGVTFVGQPEASGAAAASAPSAPVAMPGAIAPSPAPASTPVNPVLPLPVQEPEVVEEPVPQPVPVPEPAPAPVPEPAPEPEPAEPLAAIPPVTAPVVTTPEPAQAPSAQATPAQPVINVPPPNTMLAQAVEAMSPQVPATPEPVAIPESPVPPAAAAVAEVAQPVPPAAPVISPSAEPAATQTPKAAVAGSEVSAQIEKAEHEIDDLLSTSLIHPTESSGGRHRLIEPPPSTAGTEVPPEIEQAGLQQLSSASAEGHELIEHGLKVIQPLEPIVPPKEEIAREIAELEKPESAVADQKQPPAASVTAPSESAPEIPVQAVVVKPQPISPTKPEPSEPAVASSKPQGQTEIVGHQQGEMMGVPPTLSSGGVAGATDVNTAQSTEEADSTAAVELDGGLPPSMSLAADEVARSRADREAKKKLAPPEIKPQPAQPAADHSNTGGKRKRRHRGGKPAEPAAAPSEPKTQAEAQAQAEAEAGPMTGKLILPTAKKPTDVEAVPKLERPKKLAPGEVFVDEKGNVMIGE